MHKNVLTNQAATQLSATSFPIPVLELHAGYKDQILLHLLALNDDDRCLRFGTQTSNEVIERYVDRIDFNKDAVFASFDSNLNMIGMAHLAYLPKAMGRVSAAELGVSVLSGARGRGVGAALFQRSAVHSRNTKIDSLFVHCLANNKAMMSLAQKAGMRVEYADGDADAYLELSPGTAGTMVDEAVNEQWAGLDYSLKENIKRSSYLWHWLLGRPYTST
ncbi:GNAT family N-acetyltransferase [Polynucleobacter sp. TUM22923]|uniref:GNAT family N-acetyltransferase n=1 Tax=Polynucleobacter sp. TUM22923 TaxID=3022126 RepID=UPI0025740DD2|nr:GNAT family N-acetyltransferase [Polynucleobacter sp. TUM22923]BDX20713.1 GNAT family N-acetyltransferase [Polynucleobacter sp. TUM22923]